MYLISPLVKKGERRSSAVGGLIERGIRNKQHHHFGGDVIGAGARVVLPAEKPDRPLGSMPCHKEVGSSAQLRLSQDRPRTEITPAASRRFRFKDFNK